MMIDKRRTNTNNEAINFGFNSWMKIDIIIIIVTLTLLTIGVLFIYSSEYIPSEYDSQIKITGDDNIELSLYLKQIIFIIPSLILGFLIFLFRTDKIQKLTWVLYIGILLMLVLVLVIGERKYGSKSWFGIGVFGIQPSEFAKLVTIIALAWYINKIGDKIKDWKYFLLSIGIVSPIIGLIFLQPDYGTVMVFIPIIIIMLFIGGSRILHILTITIGGIIALIGGVILKAPNLINSNYNFFLSLLQNKQHLIIIIGISLLIIALSLFLLRKYKKNILIRITLSIFLIISIGIIGSLASSRLIKDHHINRFISFMEPSADPQDTGYSLRQSIIAIGAGGSDGQGWLKGKQNHLGFITVKWADYIFSVYAEEMGFIGVLLLLILYGLLIFRGVLTIYYAKDMFGGLIASGIVAMIVSQVFINIAVTIGIFPVVGITLPYLSAGGSSIITFILASSLLVNIQYEGKSSKREVII